MRADETHGGRLLCAVRRASREMADGQRDGVWGAVHMALKRHRTWRRARERNRRSSRPRSKPPSRRVGHPRERVRPTGVDCCVPRGARRMRWPMASAMGRKVMRPWQWQYHRTQRHAREKLTGIATERSESFESKKVERSSEQTRLTGVDRCVRRDARRVRWPMASAMAREAPCPWH